MTFIAESITTFYDKQEDRLRLIFNGAENQQLMGLMTRQMLKRILGQLPDWLIQQPFDSSSQTSEQKRIIQQMDYQVSQQDVPVVYNEIEPYDHVDSFLIGTVNFAKREKPENEQLIKLEFMDLSNTYVIIFVLNAAQLHKFIGEILKQVVGWDVENPWLEKDLAYVPLNSKNRVIH